MIAIDRARVQRPAVLDLDDPTSKGAKETVTSKAYFDNPATAKKPKYEAYSHDTVKTALLELFRSKCAYCEVSVLQARDIEHFRPKGRIDPGQGRPEITPGYTWLAADWDNLLLSCPDCNQRKRKLVRDDRGEWTFEEEASGKLDQFPLSDPDKHVRDYDLDAEKQEKDFRLLLNPCLDKPHKHLRFDDQGQVIARQLNGEISEKAEVSIIVFALARTTLNEARKATYLRMVRIMDSLRFIDRMLANATAADADLIRSRFDAKEKELTEFLEEGSQYSAMAKHLSRRWFRTEIPQLRGRLDAKFPV